MRSPLALTALLRLASSQLPIGGYSYSQGLELAVDRGMVCDRITAHRWLNDQLLLNLARFEAPLLLAHCQAAEQGDWSRLAELDERHVSSRETRELALESRQMGYSLKQLLCGLNELDEDAHQFLQSRTEPGFALCWAMAARCWKIPPEQALSAWLWTWLENQLSVLMKTLPLGQQAAQCLCSELLPVLEQAQEITCRLPAQSIGTATFALSLTSMAHERQYSRLFRS